MLPNEVYGIPLSQHNVTRIMFVTMSPALWQTKSGASLKEAHILALPVTTLCVSLIASFNWHMLIAVHIYRLHVCTHCVIIQSIYICGMIKSSQLTLPFS